MMQLLLIVATSDLTLQSTVEQRRADIIPPAFRRDNHALLGGATPNVSCYKVDRSAAPSHFIEHLRAALTDQTAGVIVFAEQQAGLINGTLTDICFVTEFVIGVPLRSPQNFLGALLTRVLRNYRALTLLFDNAKYRKIFTLPVRNFKGEELVELRKTCADSTNINKFADRVENILMRLRHRQRPKRFEDYDDMYLVDDDDKHFQLGKERHAQADTKIPPHTTFCVLANQFRFGRRFDGGLHYNVSAGRKNERMDGDYPDCHNVRKPGGGQPRLNMFANDFF